jgi:hypothetical protein
MIPAMLLASRWYMLLWPQRFPHMQCFNGSAVPLELLSIVLYFEVGVIQGQMAHGILMELTEGGAEHERILTTWTSNEVRNH